MNIEYKIVDDKLYAVLIDVVIMMKDENEEIYTSFRHS